MLKSLFLLILFALISFSEESKCLPCYFVPTKIEPEVLQDCFCYGNPNRINREYLNKIEFDSSGKAFLYADSGWVLINRKGIVLLNRIATMDNGPDEIKNGLIRFIEKVKWGYANTEGKKIIPAKYDGALPFVNGIASVCLDCREKSIGEYHSFEGGKKFQIDTLGNVLNSNLINDAVPDAEAAIKIALDAWIPIYGKSNISRQKPYSALLRDSIWVVTGTLPSNMLGGVAEAEISKNTGKVLKVIHGK